MEQREQKVILSQSQGHCELTNQCNHLKAMERYCTHDIGLYLIMASTKRGELIFGKEWF